MPVSADLIAISAVFVVVVVVVVGIYLRKRRTRLPHPYPPGPNPLPFIGNVLDVPQQFQWRRFCEWKYRYGDVVSITLFGQRMVILNTIQASVDLLEKKGAQYSDKPVLHMGGTLLGWDQMLMMSLMDRLRAYHELIEEEIRRSLVWTMRSPEEYRDIARRATTGISTRITCGHRPQEGHDHILELIERTINAFIITAIPGSFMVDIFPMLRYLPGWLPGQGWKKQAVEWRALTDAMIEATYALGKDNAINGSGESSIVGDYMKSDPNMPADKEYSLKKALASMAGGTDTTFKNELNTKSTPSSGAIDFQHLQIAIACRIPHLTTEDDVYRGYFIPKGSIVISNLWQITHDMENYKNHTEFEPERFLGEKPELDPRDVVFGFGRRICPGINLGQASLFAFCAMTLAVFDISKTVENGVEITPDVGDAEYYEAGVSHPPPFRCRIKARSPSAEALILGDN